jgi:S1-C subfamily serine protease
MKRHHKILLGGFGTVVLIFMIVTTILLNSLIIKQQVNYNRVMQEITRLDRENQDKINELAISMINSNQNVKNQLSSVNQEINLLKASTAEDFSEIIENSIKSVVTIRTLDSQGTGFLITSDGYLITNAHVITNTRGEISKVIQAITENNEIKAVEFIGANQDMDLALLKISGAYDPLLLKNSNDVQVGEKVIAIGNPQGFQFSVTDGIVSAIHRPSTNGQTYVQTNAELNPGNSGGPLINTQGKVIGINNFKIAETEGMGFALESDYIKLGVNELSNLFLNQTLI